MECYRIELHTIFGPRMGWLRMERSAGTVHGEMELLGRENPFQGRCEGAEKLSLSGVLQGRYRPLSYTLNCQIHDDAITGDMTTPICRMHLSGQRTASKKEEKKQ